MMPAQKVLGRVLGETRHEKLERAVVLLGFAAIYAILLSYFKPELLLSATTASGGDTGAHHYVAHYLIDHLLPKGKLAGWSPGWYAGFPMLHFYFPLPFLVIAVLSTVIKYQVAFKIGTVLGTFLLPVTTYFAFKVLKFRFPLPIIGAGFSLLFLFMESYTIYGGNILSTLAGEFGYSLSFALSILFMALLYRDVTEQQFRVSTAVLLAIVALSHVVTTMMVVFISTYYLLNRLNLKRFLILAGVFGLGFALSALWALPFIAKISYTAHMQWDQLRGLRELLPDPVRPFIWLTAIGVVGAVLRRDNRMFLFLWGLVVAGSLFFVLPPGRVWNGRMLPYFYYLSFFWAAYGAWTLRKVAARLFYGLFALPTRYAEYALVAVVFAVLASTVFGSTTTAPNWISWNYSGFEGKEHWKSFNEINQYIKGLPPGRVMIEHSPDIDKFGTPRAFELLPYFAEHDTLEGTLMEASISAPFHFVNQAELSEKPSNAILGVEYPALNVDMGVKHLRLFNIDYFLALTETVKSAAGSNPDLTLLKTFDVPKANLYFALYKVKTEGYVTIPKYGPLRVSTKDWRDTALAWYARPELLEAPLLDSAHLKGLKAYPETNSKLTGDIELQPLEGGKVSNVKLSDDALEFDTTAVGRPHWVKISYFPNWKAQGAEGPFLASPTFMMVIPKQKHVRLYYGSHWSDAIGGWLSFLGWAFVFGYALVFAWRRVPKLVGKLAGEATSNPEGTGLEKNPERSLA